MKKNLLLFLVMTCISVPSLFAQVDKQDSLALLALYHSTNGANWNTTWDLEKPVSEWEGVNLIRKGRFVGTLRLAGNNLTGTIPPEIGDFTMLGNIDVKKNKLTGTLPEEIGNLTDLRYLTLGNNQLYGELPESLGNLKKLLVLSLSKNQFTGALPPQIGEMESLKFLQAYFNQFTSISPEIANLENLVWLGLGYNNLGGDPNAIALPDGLGSLKKLVILALDNNEDLTGSVPDTFTQLTRLTHFFFNNTQLCVPEDRGLLKWLEGLTVVRGTGLDCGDILPPPFDDFPLLLSRSYEEGNQSYAFELSQNHPNPASNATTIPFYLAEATDNVQVRVVDGLGREVLSYTSSYGKGFNEVQLDLSQLETGVYLYSVKTNTELATKRMVVRK